ncbi:MAG TPA: phosphate acyltransferase PlsX, partial [Anaeromyxobacteraceae bacterium]|nr:phosphate acyltransferase PlsX [Anaeromyxobacteraceae bacterium]
ELDRCGFRAHLPVTVKHAAEVVGMDDHPGQVMRRKKDNSIRVCFELVKRGEACGMVSAGNSGAVMTGAIFVLGRLPSVERPAIISVLPALKGHPLLLDMGANVDCKSIHLVQFALMGEVYARRVLGIERPRVAVLANGEEESKGNELTRSVAAALRRAGDIHFRGYCEGRDLLTGEFDVIVTDGFTGNVALKAMEGTARVVGEMMKGALKSTLFSSLGGLLARRALRKMNKRLDWREIGGAPLVGVEGVGFITHGRSDALAILNAVRRARAAADAHATEEMARAAQRAELLLADALVDPDPPRAQPPRAVSASPEV